MNQITRQVLPDRLRGLALLGIVIVNAPFLGISVEGFTQQSISGPLDLATMFAVISLAEGKFYLLFSFLFGYSASFILKDQSRPNRRRYLRRLIGLFLFGMIHAVFFFSGDILITYSLLGLFLFFISRYSDRAVKNWAITAVAISVLITSSIAAVGVVTAEEETGLEFLQQALTSGTFVDAAAARFETLPLFFILLLLLQGPMAFFAFLLGLLAFRNNLLASPEKYSLLWRKLTIWGWSVGLPLQVVATALQVTALADGVPSSPMAMFGLGLGLISAPILTAGYISTVVLLVQRKPTFLSFMAPAGQMSLTVYLSESIVLSFVFAAYGLGYFGQWGAFPVVVAGVVTWAILTIASNYWLKKFSQGPFEKVLATISRPRN
ncbi:uncharacterized protein M2114_000123 [Aurantimicrobium minutum]|uniref:DUF418 domain-containing protein n=2 Tax=Aurantimicrobium minutum TaxID=708131 RepID=UPI002476503B|nr:DUF418 domain-containing protein [Aurantimicrobium minutum]MDH6207369.1 uncharacterized protein [Aurantimicrobium minutum]MDH6409799.1 uncharacterized protein [Aurantimicrobium minutum]MDH6424006.1 uncharacterized protein [Aurantimicrobium minutum]